MAKTEFFRQHAECLSFQTPHLEDLEHQCGRIATQSKFEINSFTSKFNSSYRVYLLYGSVFKVTVLTGNRSMMITDGTISRKFLRIHQPPLDFFVTIPKSYFNHFQLASRSENLGK